LSINKKEATMTTDTIVFTRGVPPPEAFPTEQLAECFADALAADPAVVLQYGQQPGYPPLRRQLAAEYGIGEGQVLVANGSLQLQDLIASQLVTPGATVLAEQPSYDRAITAFRRRGARVVGIPLELDGINIERLEAEVKRQVPAFLYVIPDFQNPAGVTTSLEKRRRIVELAEQYGFWVLEDVPYRKLRYRGSDVPMLREISPERVLTLTSFSKLLSPGMRVGYMVGPTALVEAVTKQGEFTYLSPVLPTQAAVAQYIKRGWLQPNIDQLKAIYTPRWAAMLDAVRTHLPGVESSEPDGGFFVSVTLPRDANSRGLVERAKQIGLVLTAGQPFFADPDQGEAPDGERFVRLPFCAVTPAQIDEGVRRLASLL
jgi:2-aminoadipate transaminase